MLKRMLLSGGVLSLALSMGGCGEGGSSTPPGPPPPTPTDRSAGPVAPSPSITTATQAQADKLISDAGDYIKNNKMDLADESIKKLEAMKPNLPPEYGPKIDQLRKTFDTAKAGGGMKLPGM